MKLSLPSPLLPCLLSTSSTLSLFIFTFFLLHRFPLLLLQLLLLSRLLLLLLLPRLFPPSSPPPASPPSLPSPAPSPTLSPSQSPSFFCLQHLVRLTPSQAFRSHPTGPGSIPAYPYKALPFWPSPPGHVIGPIRSFSRPTLRGWNRSDGLRLTLRNLP